MNVNSKGPWLQCKIYIILHIQYNQCQNPNDAFCKNRKIHSKIYMKRQGTPNSQKILKKQNKVEGLTLPNVKTCYKAIVIKTVWHWQTDRQMKQLNREPQNRPLRTAEWFHQGCQDRSAGGKGSPSNKWCWDNWISIKKRMK